LLLNPLVFEITCNLNSNCFSLFCFEEHFLENIYIIITVVLLHLFMNLLKLHFSVYNLLGIEIFSSIRNPLFYFGIN